MHNPGMLPPFMHHQPSAAAPWSRDVVAAQQASSRVLDPLVIKPHLSSFLLEDIDLVLGSNDIEHKLGRKLRGWMLARDQAPMAGCKVRPSATIVGIASGTAIAMNTEDYDWLGNYDTSTYRFTAPHAGLYDIQWSATIVSINDAQYSYSYSIINAGVGSYSNYGYSGAAGEQTTRGSDIINLSAGDTVGVGVGWSEAGNNDVYASGDNYTHMQIQSRQALNDDQSNSPDQTKFLRLYSERARTVSLVVF